MATVSEHLADLSDEIESLRDIGRRFYARGWSLGTSSNYSVVTSREPVELLVTASGKDKGQLSAADFVRIGAAGRPLLDGQPKSSAETMLHVALAGDSHVGSVLHTHSVWGTLLSDLDFERGQLVLEGYEMLKGLAGISTHDARVPIKIFNNTQDIENLATEVKRLRAAEDPATKYAFLIQGHGLYTWGRDVDEARRHVEVLEFLFEVTGRRRSIK